MLFLSPLLTLVRAGDRARAPVRVAAPAAGDVPGAVGRAAARRRGRGRRRRSGHRRARGEGLRPGGPRARRASPTTSEGLYRSRVRTVRLQARYSSALQAIPAFGQVGGARARRLARDPRRDQLGTFLAFSTYLVQLLAPVRMFAGMVAVAEQARAGAERIFDSSTPTPLVTEKPDAHDARRSTRGEVVVRRTSPSATCASEPVLARLLAARRAGRDRRARRRVGLGQVDRRACCSPASTTCRTAPIRIDGVDVARRHARLAAPRDRHRVRGRVPVLRHGARQHRVRPPRRHRRRRRARRAQVAGAHQSSSRRSPTATTPSSASAGSRSRVGSASASPSPVPCSPTRACSCSTTPRRRSTPAPRSRSTPRCARSWSTAPRSSSPTAARPCASPTASC